MSQPTRSLWGKVIKNFIESLKPRRFSGDLKGVDYNGTKYYEIPPNPSIGKRRASRWFEPKSSNNFQQDLPAEWESWLRGRRIDPPTKEEISKNLDIIRMKKRNAVSAVVEVEKNILRPNSESFPERPDYELTPGQKKDNGV